MDNLTVLLRAAMTGWQGNLWTALPAVVESYDPVAMTLTAQPTIQVGVLQPDGSNKVTSLPVIPDVPVVFPGGGGFTMTFPLAKGDEVLLVFASRCIDAWWQSGGVQPQAEFRMHDLSDGFAIPGPRSQAKKLTNVSAENVQLRTDDGAGLLEVLPNGGLPRLRLVFPGGIEVVAPTVELTGNFSMTGGPGSAAAFSGNIVVDGTIGVTGDLTAQHQVTANASVPGGGVGLSTHVHPGNNTPPTPGS